MKQNIKSSNHLFALVDCNNFYVSCERVFNPKLKGKPIVVLSNNDGCIIARSNEAKALGIPMGAPFFEYEPFIKKHNVIVYSSNYALYGDMSARVMTSLMQLYSEVEVYSIDEAFLQFNTLSSDQTETFAFDIRKHIKQWTGIPISIGIGPTKTLAKIANKIAKKNDSGIFDISNKNIDEILKTIKTADLWGIGRQYEILLKRYRITNAYQLKYADDRWIKKHMTICGLRTVHELRGIACIALQEGPEQRKSIACTRSFGKATCEFEDLNEAVATYTARAAEKLRKQKLIASAIYVFITTKHYSKFKYSNAVCIQLPCATSYTPQLIKYALQALKTIYRSEYYYKKAGIILLDFIDENHAQIDAFIANVSETQSKFIKTVDHINRKWGRKSVHFAAEGIKKPWIMKQSKKSAPYTTSWNSLLRINL